MDHIVILSQVASMLDVESDYLFFREDDPLDALYLLVEGEVAIVTEVPAKRLVITTGGIVPGELFGWSSIIPPHVATATARASAPGSVIVFDCRDLRRHFARDTEFAYLLTQRVAQVIRERLNTLRMESLASNARS
jgi:CRP-like cAMP-binding protein